MNQRERTHLAEQWAGLAQMYGRELNKTSLKIMIDAVEDLELKDVICAFTEWVKTSKQSRYPLPADIRQIVQPETDDKSLAIVLARKLDKAISTHGYNWEEGYFGANGNYWEGAMRAQFPSFKEAVLSELGPIGWATIRLKGGWKQTCQSANEMEEGMFIAQTRDLVQSNMELERQGVDLAKLDMPKPKNEITSANESIKSLLSSVKEIK